MALSTLPIERKAQTWAIVGASRGIGHEFVRQLLSRGDRVFAAVRQQAAVHDVSYWTNANVGAGSCHVLECDMLSEQSIDSFAGQLAAASDFHVDYVVLNAGVLKYPNRATELSYDDFALHLHTNTIGPIICAQRLLKSKISIGSLVFMSSDSGSAARFREMEDGFAAYAASKAALNQTLRHMAAELRRKGDGTTIIALHPGEVDTDMARIELGWDVEGQMAVDESVAACIRVIESKDKSDSGTFWTWDGQPYPW